MAVEGDLRFLSHHDMMRAMERIAVRAKLPLRYSQGFNPHPILSLPCPRPVGVATRDDVLVLALDAPVLASSLLASLNAQAPLGLSFLDAHVLPEGQSSVQPTRVEYEVPIESQCLELVKEHIETLQSQDAWIVERRQKIRRARNDQPPRTKGLDVKPMIAEITLTGERLRFACVSHEDKWAKPGEILHLLELHQPEIAAGVVRTKLCHD